MFKKLVRFLKEVRLELMKVSWPKKEELWTSTLVVIVFSLILTVFIWIFDIAVAQVLILIMR
jgi:preprotein translocase subunit SecE|uniref:Protein translocase subunit SecE n=1 Tax=candidate division WOR-3 bacterium TaxID=2052148 RepID=A0A7C4UG06_UNCW3